jgi:plasmid stabilization system protein ParE
MTRKVFLAPRAEADLDRIAQWISEQGAPLTALDYVGRIRRFLSGLGDFPERGQGFGGVRKGLKVLSFERRAIISIVVRDNHVEVQRVFSNGQIGGARWTCRKTKPPSAAHASSCLPTA